MKVFVIILLVATVAFVSARYSTSDNSRPANQVVTVFTSEETPRRNPAGTGCYTEPPVKSSYNMTVTPICLLPFIGTAVCNSACINNGWTGGFCNVNSDCMCYRTA